MATTATPTTIWTELGEIIEAGQNYEIVQNAEREQLAARLDAALDAVRRLEAELEELRAEVG